GRIAAAREQLARAEKAPGTERQAALTRLVSRLEADRAGAGDAWKVGMLAGVVRQLASGPQLAQAQ
ncbi:MAG: hypothetical protein ACJ8DJ_15435, partial [Gemmatimonadales bacterium]